MAKFNHRIVVLVSLNGLRTDCELFEEACAQRGWPILEPATHPTGRRLHEVTYTVEVRVQGAYSGAVRGARYQLEQVGLRYRLDLHALAAQRLQPDSRRRFLWRPYVDLPAVPPGHIPAWAWTRVRRLVIRVRLRDTGRDVQAATEAEALSLARRPLPGVEATPPGIRVRPTIKEPESRYGMRWARRLMFQRQIYLWLVTMVCAALLPNAIGHGAADLVMISLLGLVVATGGSVLLLVQWLRESEGMRRREMAVAFLMTWGAVFAFGWMLGDDRTSWRGTVAALILGGVFLVFRGLILFIRQRTWRTWVPWVLPAMLPFAFGAFPGVGSFVHLAYLDAFGVDLGEVGVPAFWQLYAALRWAAPVLVLLIGPAAYGLIRNNHLPGEDRLVLGTLVATMLILVAVWVSDAVVLGPARDAGVAARRAAAYGDTPAPYYGIEPEWVCARPLAGTQPGEIPVQGGTLVPSRPYLMLGDSGGTVVLWEPGTKKHPDRGRALKLPLAKLRIAPTAHPDGRCA